MSTQQMIGRGRKEITEVDKALKRSEKVVEDTIAIATSTAETLHKQTEQLERTLDNLDEIHFTLKKAKQVIRDITRGIATDKCVGGRPCIWLALWLTLRAECICQIRQSIRHALIAASGKHICVCRCIMTLTMLSIMALIALILIRVLHIGQHTSGAKKAAQDLAVCCPC